MHPTIYQQLTQARIAELHRQADQARLARAARREHRAQRPQPSHRVPALRAAVTRQVLAVLGIRSL
jgi:hypothetical protein